MKLLDKIPKIEGDELFEYHEVIGSRIYENVFRLSRKIVLKKTRIDFGDEVGPSDKPISYEFGIQKSLYDLGFPVPYPFGMLDIEEILGGELNKSKAILMEYIEGKDLLDLIPNSRGTNGNALYKLFRLEFPELANKAEEEISKARKIGFNPGADALMPYNLRLSENNKLFLIDFGLWNHNEVPVHPLRDSYDFSKIQSPQSAFPE
ncbi:MAG TPA: hypothetical protein VJZ93_04200 [Candidatus Nanoarchaeia archaeon]|nr:hypothetical protein [Candidatus Nanoarchaeia archaeon]